MTKYRVRDGYRHGARNQYGPGDIVELSESEAKPLLDKLERVEDKPAPATVDAPPLVLANDEPDDLTEITHIGAATQETLNRMGVHTYADLVAIIDESPHLLRDAIGGVTADRVEAWREEAMALMEADNG